MDKKTRQWNMKYKLLKKYIEQHKKLPVCSTNYKDINIGLWVSRQITNYNKNKLSSEKIDKLNDIDIWKWYRTISGQESFEKSKKEIIKLYNEIAYVFFLING